MKIKVSLIIVVISLATIYLIYSKIWYGWDQFVIDSEPVGADGVKVIPLDNKDEIHLLASWEESGLTRLYSGKYNDWNVQNIGITPDVEDALIVKWGAQNTILSFCEGRQKTIYSHTFDKKSGRWLQNKIPLKLDDSLWMTGSVLEVDQENHVVICGGKINSSILSLSYSSGIYTSQELAKSEWTMSIIPYDIDNDGDLDIVYTDRLNEGRGCWWLENPNNQFDQKWSKHLIGSGKGEFMFADIADIDADGMDEILVAYKEQAFHGKKIKQASKLIIFNRDNHTSEKWTKEEIPFPYFTGSAKGIQCGDMNNDGLMDIVLSCEDAFKGRIGIFMFINQSGKKWKNQYISSFKGIKFDQIELHDIDNDNDLDIITTEEWENLGVIWFRNPHI
mgnify:CR=1 FL=1